MIETRYQKQPLVAVVTPVYNGSPYLEGALACVQAQTYRNLVHVVLDNASTDDTPQVIARAAGGRVPILTQRNPSLLPQVDNWNAVVAMTPPDAKYFRLLSADDLMTPDAIERLVALAESDPEIGLVCSPHGVGGTHTDPARVDGRGLPVEMHVFDGRWLVKTYLMRLHGAVSPTHMLIKRQLLVEGTPFYRKGVASFDTDACLRVVRGCKFGFVHDVLAWTRLHKDSETSHFPLHKQTYVAEWLAWIDLFGPTVMSPSQLAQCRRIHLRHYFRRLLLWRLKQRDKALVDRHLAFLAEHSPAESMGLHRSADRVGLARATKPARRCRCGQSVAGIRVGGVDRSGLMGRT